MNAFGKSKIDYDFLKYFKFTYRFGLIRIYHRDFGPAKYVCNLQWRPRLVGYIEITYR